MAAPVAVRAWIEERIRLRKNTRDDAQIKEAEQWIDAAVAQRQQMAFAPSAGGRGRE
jgi:hypothetical protein